MQRPAIASRGERLIGGERLAPRFIRHHENEGIQARVVGLDPPQTLVRDLLRGDLTGPKPAPEFLDGHHLSA